VSSKPTPPAPLDTSRSTAVPEELALTPPFWGSCVLTEADIDLGEVFRYLDRNALFAGQWQLRKTQQQNNRCDVRNLRQQRMLPDYSQSTQHYP
jgi:5-methyltetrahydrofolate--homocysteine methyltransferase